VTTPTGEEAHESIARDGHARESAGDDDRPILPSQTRDDTEAGWGERHESNDDRLLADRPPHWE
jgi:hypothetical protein